MLEVLSSPTPLHLLYYSSTSLCCISSTSILPSTLLPRPPRAPSRRNEVEEGREGKRGEEGGGRGRGGEAERGGTFFSSFDSIGREFAE
jgi:hypothetical protein